MSTQYTTALQYQEQGSTKFTNKQYDDAIVLYTHGIESPNIDNKSLATLYNNRSACYLALKQYQQCVNNANISLQLQPNDNPQALYLRQQAYEALENIPAATSTTTSKLTSYDIKQFNNLLPSIQDIVISYLPYDYQLELIVHERHIISKPGTIANRVRTNIMNTFNGSTAHIPIQVHVTRQCYEGCDTVHKYIYCNAINHYVLKNLNITVCVACDVNVFWTCRYEFFQYMHRVPVQQPSTVQPNDIWYNVPLTSNNLSQTSQTFITSMLNTGFIANDTNNYYANCESLIQTHDNKITIPNLRINVNLLTWAQQFTSYVAADLFTSEIMFYNSITNQSDVPNIAKQLLHNESIVAMCVDWIEEYGGTKKYLLDDCHNIPNTVLLRFNSVLYYFFRIEYALSLMYTAYKSNQIPQLVHRMVQLQHDVQAIVKNTCETNLIVCKIFMHFWGFMEEDVWLLYKQQVIEVLSV